MGGDIIPRQELAIRASTSRSDPNRPEIECIQHSWRTRADVLVCTRDIYPCCQQKRASGGHRPSHSHSSLRGRTSAHPLIVKLALGHLGKWSSAALVQGLIVTSANVASSCVIWLALDGCDLDDEILSATCQPDRT
eukprot:3100957-Amphidinium_carterae.1